MIDKTIISMIVILMGISIVLTIYLLILLLRGSKELKEAKEDEKI